MVHSARVVPLALLLFVSALAAAAPVTAAAAPAGAVAATEARAPAAGAPSVFAPLEIEPASFGDLAQVNPTKSDDEDDEKEKEKAKAKAKEQVKTEPAGEPAPADELDDLDQGPSRGKVILLSALVPGLGQLEAGHTGMGTVFLIGEAACWASLAIFRVQGNERQDRYIEYAGRFAGVADAGGQSDDYYGNLAKYDHSGEPGGPDSYNEMEVRLVARELYPDDRAQQDAYILENQITGDQAWDWESDERRFEYGDIRVASETAYHRSEYAVAGLVVGRILSVMHAVWLTADKGDQPADGGTDRGAVVPYAETDFALGAGRVGVRYMF